MRPETILVPVDESRASMQALRRAVGLAKRVGARMRIFHALVHRSDRRHADEHRLEWLDRVGEQARDLDVDYISHDEPSVFEGIAHVCEETRADLIVMGTHGGGFLASSVAETLVRRAPCNVMVCRSDASGDWPASAATILVPVDHSDNALRAAQYARELVDERDRLAFLHVVSTPDHPDVHGSEVPAPLGADPELEARIVRRTRNWLDDRDADVTAVEGDVVASILDHAQLRNAGLVVMGTKGLTGLTRLVIGSVTERITGMCEVPVLTVR